MTTMADKRDYYQVLGIGRGAAEDEIKRAYRQLARKWHPDVNKDADAESRFKEITEAYEVLSDSRKRQLYDQYGHAGPQAGAGGFEGFPFGDIGDLFESFFGGSSTRRGPQRGGDLRLRLGLAFQEAVFGVEREIEIPRWESCLICGGSGAEPGKPPVRCPQCNGSGEVRRVQQSIFGQFVNVMPCDRCKGEGQIVQHKCQECNGNGRVRRVRKVAVTVPAGVDNGMEMRLTAQGEGGDRGGPNGDLYIQLQVEPHPFLKRDGVDLVYELPLNVAQAALGAEVEVPTLEGSETLRIPPGTQHGRVFRVRDKGVPRLQRAGRGDFRAIAHVEVPATLSSRQRELFAQLADTFAGIDVPDASVDGAEPREKRARPAKGKGILDKVREAIGLEDE